MQGKGALIMKGFGRKGVKAESVDERCDTKVWSGACEKNDYTNSSDKYLCVACGTIKNLDHEVRHEVFPLVSGDYDNLS